ncbi:hypothetical protein Tco_0278733, partial [Tanacetum coccineum]
MIDVMCDREDKYAELEAKCEAAMADFDKNPAVMVLLQKIVSLLAEVKELKVAMLEGEKSRLQEVETQLCQEVEDVKHDRAKVVPYITMDLVH